MTKSKTVAGMKVELRTSQDAEFVSEVFVDGVRVGCDAMQFHGCDALYGELIRDKSGDKAKYVKRIAV